MNGSDFGDIEIRIGVKVNNVDKVKSCECYSNMNLTFQ